MTALTSSSVNSTGFSPQLKLPPTSLGAPCKDVNWLS